MGTDIFPPGRYGRRRAAGPGTRWILPAVICAGLLAGLAIAVALFEGGGSSTVTSQVVGLDYHRAHQVTITFQVTKPAGVPATCIVRARSYAGTEIGRARVPVPAGRANQRTVTVRYTLHTNGKPNTGEVQSCTLAH